MDSATMAAIDKNAGYDVFASEVPRVVASSIVFIAVPTIFVALRFTSRIVSKATLWVSRAQYRCVKPGTDRRLPAVGRLDDPTLFGMSCVAIGL